MSDAGAVETSSLFESESWMSGTYAGFIDASFLRAEGAKSIGQSPKGVRPDAQAVVSWFRFLERQESLDQTFLRAYWYDSAFDPSHSSYAGQRSFFDAIALTPGLQLRLGHIAEGASPLEQPIRRALGIHGRRTRHGAREAAGRVRPALDISAQSASRRAWIP